MKKYKKENNALIFMRKKPDTSFDLYMVEQYSEFLKRHHMIDK